MKKLIALLCLIPSISFADDFDCGKKSDGHVECHVKKDDVWIYNTELNGGECQSPFHGGIHKRLLHKGDKFTVPGTKECPFVRSLKIFEGNGKTEFSVF